MTWKRPESLPTSVFRAFTAEAEGAVGLGHEDLLAAIDDELNATGQEAPVLLLTEEEARQRAEAWASREPLSREDRRQRYLRHLAFCYELAFRRVKGPALFERQKDVTPCPDFLPCTSGQVHQGLFGVYRALAKAWNLALIVVIVTCLPLITTAVLRSLLLEGETSRSFLRLLLIVWSSALAILIVGFSACRLIRSRGCSEC